MEQTKLLPTTETISTFVTYNAEMNAALKRNDLDLANEYLRKVEALTTEYDFFDQEFTENGLTGLKDITGKVRIPALYKAIGDRYRYDHWRSLPVAVINEDDKYALAKADGSGTPLCEFAYDYITCFPWTDHFRAHVGNKTTLLCPDGTALFPAMVDTIYEPFNYIIILKDEDKYGFCTLGGDFVAPRFEEIEPDEDNKVHVRLGDTWGYISGEGEFLPEPLSEEDYDKWLYNFDPDWED